MPERVCYQKNKTVASYLLHSHLSVIEPVGQSNFHVLVQNYGILFSVDQEDLFVTLVILKYLTNNHIAASVV